MRERVLEAIQQKIEGQDITTRAERGAGDKIIDLMDALKASLAKRGASTAEKMPAKQAGPKLEKDEAVKEPVAKPRRKASGAR